MSRDISVLIPVYNAERTLSRCLQSLCEQTLRPQSVIIVDDASVDNTVVICQSFQNRLPITLIRNAHNRGCDYARKLAYKRVQTSLLIFQDADDWLAPNALEDLAKLLQEYNADWVAGRAEYRDISGALKKNPYLSWMKISPQANVTEVLDYNITTLLPVIHGVLFTRYFLDRNQIRFGEHRIGGDRIFMFKAYHFAHEVHYLDSIIYYRESDVHSGSITTQRDDRFFLSRMKVCYSVKKYCTQYRLNFLNFENFNFLVKAYLDLPDRLQAKVQFQFKMAIAQMFRAKLKLTIRQILYIIIKMQSEEFEAFLKGRIITFR